MARKHQTGDALIGIVSNDAGFIGNLSENKNQGSMSVLVGLMGQLVFNEKQVIIENGIIYTKDMQKIGILLANGKVYLRIN